MENKKMSDIFSMLDQASVFSCGKPVKQNLELLKKPREKKNTRKDNKYSAEEKAYAEMIGYVYSDNEDDGNEEYNVETTKNYSTKMEIGSSNGYKPRVNGNIVSIGRGRFLNYDYESDYQYHPTNTKPVINTKSVRQEQNDRVISEQLREVIGCGTSNEEIEDAFAKKFRKNIEQVPTSLLEESNSIKFSGTSSVSSLNSVKSSRKSERDLYIPPALRKNNKEETLSFRPIERNVVPCNVEDLSTKSLMSDDNSLLFGETSHKPLPPIKFHSLPYEYGGLKVASIYDYEDMFDDNCSKSSDEVISSRDKVNDDSFIDCDSSEDVVIVEVKDTVCEDKPYSEFKMTESENKFKKFGGGRNALINGLLKRNAGNHLETKESFKDVSVLKIPNLTSSNFMENSNYIVKNSFGNLSGGQDDSRSDNVVDNKVEWMINDVGDNSDNNCSTASSQTSSRYSNVSHTDSVLYNSSPKKTTVQLVTEDKPISSVKMYNHSILVEKTKSCGKKTFTLGDYLSPMSVKNSHGKLKKASKLNPSAPTFIPNSSTSHTNICDLRLNNENFPPLLH